ncbi:MAG TPA: DUF3828 domain-containing protein [Xanthobacteraceae bacterium]|nr:DUF3828 domain-containing protein [Xanthobacteraceae bacterium]
MIGICGRAGASLLGLILIAAFCGSASAQGASPSAFITSIYKPYTSKTYKGARLDTPARIRRYFEPALANVIIKDMAEADKRKEVPTLDGDPFIDAQDWEVANLTMDVKQTGEKALATVNFTNFRELKTVSLDLVKTSAGWRIADIRAPSGSLRELYKLK